MPVIEIEVKPFGRVTLNVWAAMTDDQTKVFCEVQNNPFVPLVNAITADARALGLALIEAADAAERTAQGIAAGSKAEAQRAAGLRTMPKPGEPGFKGGE